MSGKPILASDPHLPLMLPGIWYANDLRAPGFHVSGISIPGVPAVVIGHNDNIAWGMTNLFFDVQDLYFEHGSEETVEAIRVKDQGVVRLQTSRSRHGPLAAQVTLQGSVAGNPQAVMRTAVPLYLHWRAADPDAVSFPLLALNRATNWSEFREALRRWTTPAQTFIYADTAGNIGLQAAGSLPNRTTYAGDVPVDGTSEKFEWEGDIPFDSLPSVYNPDSGMVVSANENPFPADYPYRVNGVFAPPDRALQIAARLKAKRKVSVGDMMGVQRDVYSAFHHFLAGQLVKAAAPRAASDDRLQAAVGILKGWDGQMSAESAAGLITNLAWQNLRRQIVSRASPGLADAYDQPIATAVAERLLRQRPKEWFPDFDALLLRALLDAWAAGDRLQGSNPANWRLGQQQQLTLTSPVLGSIRAIQSGFRGWIQIGPEELAGSPTSVRQRTERSGTVIAPSARMVVDMGNLDGSVLTLATGQSGQTFSSHFKDQWPAYRDGVGLPMAWTRPNADQVLTLTPR